VEYCLLEYRRAG
jgi:hypothetical protein